MKYLITVIILISCHVSSAQRKMEERIFSHYINDTIRCSIWLPDNWDAKQNYTAIYTFSYGSSDAAYIAQEIAYLRKLQISNLPPVIIVNIWADMDLIGFNYETGQLTERGNKTVKSIEGEIMPLLEKKYKASKFRTYIGQSYGASYGNYLFLHKPDLFSAYILMAPEQIDVSQPPFEITPYLENFYKKRSTYYFTASGGLDMQRRQDFTKDISIKISKLKSPQLFFQHENISIANHNNLFAVGLPIALDFIYQHYSALPQATGSESVLSLIKQYENTLSEIYGIGVDKNSFGIYNNLLPVIWQNRDTAGLQHAINYFITSESDTRQLRDFAYSSVIVGLKDKAIKLYDDAIRKGLQNMNDANFYPGYLITSYRERAEITEKPEVGWRLLHDALKICLTYKTNIYNNYYPKIYFYLGKFAAENSYQVKEGISYLNLYLEKRKDEIIMNQLPLDLVHYYLGKCYTTLNDKNNALLHLQKAINENPQNKQAKELIETIK